MTKIKDLVTVQLDNTYRLFPIDSERYELIIALSRRLTNRKVHCTEVAEHVDETVMAFIDAVEAQLNRCATSYVYIVHLFEEPKSLLELDQARRVEAALTGEFIRELVRLPSVGSRIYAVVTELLSHLVVRLANARIRELNRP